MKLSPHDPLDDLIAAALHGDLSPAERAQFDSRLQTDPAARAAYQEAQLMHDLLEKNHRDAQPDANFEQRMLSGFRRKVNQEKRRETPWDSALVLWGWVRGVFAFKTPTFVNVALAWLIVGFLSLAALGPLTNGIKKAKETSEGRMKAQMLAQNQISYDQAKRLEEAKDAVDESRFKAIRGVNELALPAPAHPSAQGGIAMSPAPMRAPVTQSFGPDVIDMGRANAPAGFALADSPGSIPVPTTVVTDATSPRTPGAPPSSFNTNLQVAIPAWAKAKSPTKPTAVGGESPAPASAPSPQPSLKLIRNAQLDLQVKSFGDAADAIGAATKAAGGYVDTSHSQKGGNGKLQGTIVVKIVPENLDTFLLKLRDLGQVENQSVSSEDVTKEYYDAQARLDNSRRMETQLQELLQHENGKVSDLLQVERELGRVRGEIEQLQGQLKLYDFQVQYATVTITLREKDLNQAAAYLLKEQDDFALFAVDVEGTFQKARAAADASKAQVLRADLQHNSGSDVAAELLVMVAPDRIESFLAQVRTLGRVSNFTRQTQRVAKDGGESDRPADQTRTDQDDVQVHVAIRSDAAACKQATLTVVAAAVDEALDRAKTASLAGGMAEILSSSLNKTPDGPSTAQLAVRVPGKDYHALIDTFRALGRTSSFSLQRDDSAGPGASGDDEPVIVTLSLTDDETPVQTTEMAVLVTDVEAQAQSLKRQAADAGAVVKASSFQRQPDGTEVAQLTLRLSLGKYAPVLEEVKKLGRVESLSVQRQDRPGAALADDGAPAEINLQLHNQGDMVPDNTGLWSTLRETFGEGAAALFGSVKVIGVLIAFLAPWLIAFVVLAWIGRRIYVARKK